MLTKEKCGFSMRLLPHHASQMHNFFCSCPTVSILLLAVIWPACRKICVWKDGNCIKTLEAHEGPVQCLLLLPNGDFLSGSNDTTIKLWSNFKCVHTFPGHTDTVRQDPVTKSLTVPFLKRSLRACVCYSKCRTFLYLLYKHCIKFVSIAGFNCKRCHYVDS